MTSIIGIGTAVPENCFQQSEIAEFMAKALKMNEYDARKLHALYRSTKIKTRHSVIKDYGLAVNEYEFYPQNEDLNPFPSTHERMKMYKQHALPMAIKAINDLTKNTQLGILEGITHLITVSCTGMYAPGLDIDLVEQLQLNPSLERTCINFMGCYGVFNAIKIANAIGLSDPKSKILIVSVELCTLHFQKKNSEDFLLSNALFADGAGALILVPSKKASLPNFALKSFYSSLFFEGKKDMAWEIGDVGFEMTLTSEIPKMVKKGIKQLTDQLLSKANIDKNDLAYYAIHPGGKAILESIEAALVISKEDNRFAYDVLEKYGNMSSSTVIFVWKNILSQLNKKDHKKKILSCAFGPGLTLESAILEVNC